MIVTRYRVHLMIIAHGFTAPESFRVEVYATSHDDAKFRAVQWASTQPLTGVEVVDILSSESVPNGQMGVHA